MARPPRNNTLARGINRFSHGAMIKLRGTWKFQKKGGFPAPKAAPAPKKSEPIVKEFGKKKSKRVIQPRGRNSYPTHEAPLPLPHRKTQRPTRLRSSIQPGQVLILLAGRFSGKRVVFLKQLASGLLLVTGPYKLSGVPLRRVNQSYVIATSTRVDISGVKVDEKFNDAYFKTAKPKHDNKKTEDKLMSTDAEKTAHKVDEAKAKDQAAFDKAIIEAIKKTAHLSEYMKATFSLRRGEYPHLLKF